MPVSTCLFPLTYKIVVCSLLGVTAIFSLMLNIIVCLTIYRNKGLRTVGNILIANLAISDSLIGVTLAPMELVYIAYFPSWPMKNTGIYFLNSVWLFSLVSPFVIVSVITTERYKTIKSLSFANRQAVSTKKLACVVAAMWIYSVVAVGIMVGFFEPESNTQNYHWNVKPNFYYIFLAIHIAIPLFLVSVIYYNIFKISKASTNQEIFYSSLSTAAMLRNREIKLAKTVGIVIGLLFLVWLPVMVIECFYATESTSCIIEVADPISVWLTASSGVMNPLVYFYRNPNLRGAIKKSLQWRNKKNESTNSSTNTD